MIGRTLEKEQRFFIRPTLTTTPFADGPERDIPVPRLAPWGSVKAFSSYRGRVAARQSPAAMITSGPVVGGFRAASRSNHCVRNAG